MPGTSLPPSFPALPTLHLKPSWLNAAGRIDRSACVELRVRQVRQLAGCQVWEHVSVTRPRRPGAPLDTYSPPTFTEISWRRVATRPIPHERPARNSAGREATGLFHLDLADVHALLRKLLPQRFSGDFRTEKANALRGSWTRTRADRRGVPRIPTRFTGLPRGAGTEEPTLRDGRRLVAANPNAGATREKLLTLDTHWQQPLRLEKWRQQNAILPFYYLICPGPMPWWSLAHLPGAAGPLIGQPAAVPHNVVDGSITTEHWQGEADIRCPGLSTREKGTGGRSQGSGVGGQGTGDGGQGTGGRGQATGNGQAEPSRGAASAALNPAPHTPNPTPFSPVRGVRGFRGCPQRVYFLMLPLATADELADALTAQAWILGLDPQSRRTHANFIHQLLTRYSLLFEPRCFVCAKCLGVRYGEDPEKVRQRVQKHRSKWRTLSKPKPLKKNDDQLAC